MIFFPKSFCNLYFVKISEQIEYLSIRKASFMAEVFLNQYILLMDVLRLKIYLI